MAGDPQLPIPISLVEGRYLLFDIDAITYLRRNHHVCGVFIGTLPQNPSQNVFMGLPMELMPEEAQLLLDEAVCYVLDNAKAHDIALAKANRKLQSLYVVDNQSLAAEIAEEKAKEKEIEKRKALKKVKARKGLESMGSSTETVTQITTEEVQDDASTVASSEHAESLFTRTKSTNSAPAAAISQPTVSVTPSSSLTLIPTNPSTRASRRIPNLNVASYTLYRHLNSRSYFQTPGLRFGCQFCVYPGDPLRFHSHFLAVGYQWEEEIDLMDVVGGGRLGTGVKKGWLMGGKEPDKAGQEGRVRTWSVEWAGM